jgi:hypothetical protein
MAGWNADTIRMLLEELEAFADELSDEGKKDEARLVQRFADRLRERLGMDPYLG